MPLKDTDDLKLEQKYLDQAMKLIFKYGKMPIGHFIDIEPLLLKTTKDGTLFGEDFVQIVYLLNNVKRSTKLFERKRIGRQ